MPAEHARWLRTGLVARGLCSRHAAQLFAVLGEAIVAARVADPAPALAYLRAGVAAVAHDEPERTIQAGVEELVEAALAVLATEDPAGAGDGGDEDEERRRDDLADLASCLADAVARRRPECFADHARRRAAILAEGATSVADLDRALGALNTALAQFPGPARRAARTALRAGRRSLGERRE